MTLRIVVKDLYGHDDDPEEEEGSYESECEDGLPLLTYFVSFRLDKRIKLTEI